MIAFWISKRCFMFSIHLISKLLDYIAAEIMSAVVNICTFSLKNVYSISKGTRHKVVCEPDFANLHSLLSLLVSLLMFKKELITTQVHFMHTFQIFPSLP